MRTAQIIVIAHPKDVVEIARWLDVGLEILGASIPRRCSKNPLARLDLRVAAPSQEEKDL